ncbi:cell division protein FtsQ/DivIB [Gordonia shandongensis]|uniref:cell division protein FtsQ/DivIB n=1 Tax=Gordonia shandongensis TaxID=376351 RepID=UPI0003FF3526|nr:FtsQ-type POTRA domain-containing protein [Gordonia shandongensis]
MSRVRVAALVAVLIAVVGGLSAVAYYSPLMSVRSVDVAGAVAVTRDDVLGAARVPSGRPLLQVDTAEIADRVAELPAVESVDVSRSYPSTIAIEVTERTPVVTVERDEGRIGVMDRLGVVYATFDTEKSLPKEFRRLPRLETGNPSPRDAPTAAALSVVRELPDWLAANVRAVRVDSPADVTLVLRSGRTAVWGGAERSEEKAEALRHLLTIKGREYNVSSPEFASVK